MAPPQSALEPRESWAGDPPRRGAARQRLLEATVRCVVRDGLSATGISAVAAEAGVSRPTVYRYFEDRHDLILATLLHAGSALAQDLAGHLGALRAPHRMAAEAILYVLREVPRNPLLAATWSSTVLDATVLAEATRPDIVAMARGALEELVEAAGWSDAEADEAIEVMLRMLISLLVAPGPARSEAELQGFLERRLVPALGLSPRPTRRPTRTTARKR